MLTIVTMLEKMITILKMITITIAKTSTSVINISIKVKQVCSPSAV